MSTFAKVDIEIRAQEMYEAHDRVGVPWSRRDNIIREAYRSAAIRLMATKQPKPTAPCMWPECGHDCLGQSVACK
jgi:hypothetical protein